MMGAASLDINSVKEGVDKVQKNFSPQDEETIRQRQQLLNMTKTQNETEKMFETFQQDIQQTKTITLENAQKLKEQGEKIMKLAEKND